MRWPAEPSGGWSGTNLCLCSLCRRLVGEIWSPCGSQWAPVGYINLDCGLITGSLCTSSSKQSVGLRVRPVVLQGNRESVRSEFGAVVFCFLPLNQLWTWWGRRVDDVILWHQADTAWFNTPVMWRWADDVVTFSSKQGQEKNDGGRGRGKLNQAGFLGLI